VFAASEKSATVRLDQSVTVGSSTIKAGEYKVTSTESGPLDLLNTVMDQKKTSGRRRAALQRRVQRGLLTGAGF
jgi:hypothetical protein